MHFINLRCTFKTVFEKNEEQQSFSAFSVDIEVNNDCMQILFQWETKKCSKRLDIFLTFTNG